MLNGDELWDASITRGLMAVESHGRVVSCYEDAPSSLYGSLVATVGRSPASVALISDAGWRFVSTDCWSWLISSRHGYNL